MGPEPSAAHKGDIWTLLGPYLAIFPRSISSLEIPKCTVDPSVMA